MPQHISKEQLLERAIELCEKEGLVDVVKIAEGLGIDVFAVENGDDFNAEIKYDELTGQFEIWVNQSHPFTRQRFSIAHEIAHFVLHQDDVQEKGSVSRVSYGHPDYDAQEAEADSLAAEMLLPEKIIREYIGEKKVITAKFLGQIAQKFRVSMMMAILRLKNLGYAVPYITFA